MQRRMRNSRRMALLIMCKTKPSLEDTLYPGLFTDDVDELGVTLSRADPAAAGERRAGATRSWRPGRAGRCATRASSARRCPRRRRRRPTRGRSRQSPQTRTVARSQIWGSRSGRATTSTARGRSGGSGGAASRCRRWRRTSGTRTSASGSQRGRYNRLKQRASKLSSGRAAAAAPSSPPRPPPPSQPPPPPRPLLVRRLWRRLRRRGRCRCRRERVACGGPTPPPPPPPLPSVPRGGWWRRESDRCAKERPVKNRGAVVGGAFDRQRRDGVGPSAAQQSCSTAAATPERGAAAAE